MVYTISHNTCISPRGLKAPVFALSLPDNFNPILDGVRAHPILDGGQKSPPRLTLPFGV